jgi:hypothetical protein
MGHPEQDSQVETARMEQPEQGSRKGQTGHVSGAANGAFVLFLSRLALSFFSFVYLRTLFFAFRSGLLTCEKSTGTHLCSPHSNSSGTTHHTNISQVLPTLILLRCSTHLRIHQVLPNSHSSGLSHSFILQVIPTFTYHRCLPHSHSSGAPHTHIPQMLPTLTFLRCSPHSHSSGFPTLTFLRCSLKSIYSGTPHTHIS